MAIFELLDDKLEGQKQQRSLRTAILLALANAFCVGFGAAVLIDKIKRSGDWAPTSIQLISSILLAVLFGKDALRRTRQLK